MEGVPLESVEAAGKAMQDSWIDVPQGKGEGERGEGERGEGEEEEGGALMHSRSQHEMEQLLASAASDDEAEEGDTASVPTFTIPEQTMEESGIQRVVEAGQRHSSDTSERLQSSSTALGLRASWLFGGDMVHLLFPVLVLTHLALFGLGFYIGRRTTLVKML